MNCFFSAFFRKMHKKLGGFFILLWKPAMTFQPIHGVLHDPSKAFHVTSFVLYPLKISKDPWFLIFSESIKRDLQHKMGSKETIFACWEQWPKSYSGWVKNSPDPTSFFPETSTNVGISLQNFLDFSFSPFATLV